MALPALVYDAPSGFGSFYARPFFGPYKSSNGDVYVVVGGDLTTVQLRVYKSTNPGTNAFAEQDSANRPATDNARAQDACQVGDVLHIVTRNTGSTDFRYHTFNMATDAWGTTDEDIAFNEGGTGVRAFCKIERQGSGFVGVYSTIEGVMGTNYARAHMFHGTTGSWTTGVELTTTSKAETNYEAVGFICVDGNSDISHCLITDQTDLFVTTTNGSNSVTQRLQSAITATISPVSAVQGVAYDDTGWKVRFPFRNRDDLDPYVLEFADGTTPTLSTAKVDAMSGGEDIGDALTMVRTSDGTKRIFACDDNNDDVVYFEDDGADSWGAYTSLYNETTDQLSDACLGAAFMSLSARDVIGVIFYNTTDEDVYYTEFELTTAPSGTGVQTLQLLAQSASGGQTFSGTGAQTLEQLTQVASGEQTENLTGTAAQTLQLLTQNASGIEIFSGASSQLLELLTQTAQGQEIFSGTSVQLLQLLTQNATGVMQPSGTAAQLLQLLSQTASGELAFVGTAAQALQLLVQTASGIMQPEGTAAQILQLLTQTASGEHGDTISGTGAQTLQVLVQTASGVQTISGTAAQILQLLTQDATGVMHPEGTGAQTLQLLAQTASGVLIFTGTGAQLLQVLTQDASGQHVEGHTGTAAQALQQLVQAASGIETISGSSAQALQLLTQIASGELIIPGSAAQVLQLLTQVATGEQTISGSSAQLLQLLTQVAQGEIPHLGSAEQILQLLTQASVGVETVPGSAAQLLQQLTQEGIQISPRTGTGEQTLQLLTMTAEGLILYFDQWIPEDGEAGAWTLEAGAADAWTPESPLSDGWTPEDPT